MTNTFSTDNMSTPSVLIIGAAGRTGIEVIHQLSKHTNKPFIHAFCRDPIKLSCTDRVLCSSVITGNARIAENIEDALTLTGANWILVCLGNGNAVAQTDLRTASAMAIVQVLNKPLFQNIRAMVVSMLGAGSSKMDVGFGMGKLLTYFWRHVLNDHTGQEAVFAKIANRTTIVRATALASKMHTGNLVSFSDHDTNPTSRTDRADLAAWIVMQICELDSPGGFVVNVTSTAQLRATH